MAAPLAQRRVEDAPFPNVRVSAAPTSDVYGGQIGDTVASAGVRLYDLETRAANQTAVFEADRQLADVQTNLENQLYAVRGKQALGADESLLKQFDEATEKITMGLGNDVQRGTFQRTHQVRRQQLNDVMQKHIRQEFGTFQDDETKATLQSTEDRIRRNPDNPMIVKAEMGRAMTALAAWGERKGLRGEITPEMLKDPQFQAEMTRRGMPVMTEDDLKVPGASRRFESDAYSEKRQIVESGLHKHVVDGLIAKDQDIAAAEYAKANRKNFTANDLDAVEKLVLEGSTRGESRRAVTEVVSRVGIETPDQRREADKALSEIKNDKVSDLARQRLAHEIQTFDKRKEETYTRRFELASKVLEDQGFKQPNATVRELIPVPLWNVLKPSDQASLELHLARIRKPEDHAHVPQKWLDFQELTNKQLAALPKAELQARYLNHFDGTHYDRATVEWSAARNLQEKGDDGQKYIQALGPRERIKNAWERSGIVDLSVPRSKWTNQDEVNYTRFETTAANALANLPKDAKPEEIEKVLQGLSDSLLKQKFTVDPGMFSRNKQVPAIGMQDVKDARSVRIPIADIPQAEVDGIKGLLKTAEKPMSQEKIERIYALRKLYLSGQMPRDAMMAASKAIILE